MRRLWLLVLSLSLLGFAVPISVDAATGSLRTVAPMHEARSCHSATPLDDGTILIAGGMVRERQFLASAEIFDPQTEQFTAVADMSEVRACHVAVKLNDGRVLLIGSGTTTVSATAEIYDPTAQAFSVVGSMAHPRSGLTATLLRDGKVLITGGDNYHSTYASAELFDPVTETFTPTGDMLEPRTTHTATLLPDRTVLIAGGQVFRQSTVYSTTEIYDPTTGKFTQGPSLLLERHKHAAVALPNGDVLLIGGAGRADWEARLDSIERYDHKMKQFAALNEMQNARFKIMDAVVVLPDGRVLITGGSRLVETLDPDTSTISATTDRLDEDRFYQTAALLPDGRVLIAGGYGYNIQATDKAWIYTP